MEILIKIAVEELGEVNSKMREHLQRSYSENRQNAIDAGRDVTGFPETINYDTILNDVPNKEAIKRIREDEGELAEAELRRVIYLRRLE